MTASRFWIKSALLSAAFASLLGASVAFDLAKQDVQIAQVRTELAFWQHETYTPSDQAIDQVNNRLTRLLQPPRVHPDVMAYRANYASWQHYWSRQARGSQTSPTQAAARLSYIDQIFVSRPDSPGVQTLLTVGSADGTRRRQGSLGQRAVFSVAEKDQVFEAIRWQQAALDARPAHRGSARQLLHYISDSRTVVETQGQAVLRAASAAAEHALAGQLRSARWVASVPVADNS